jgi:hypothetical protein
MENKGRDKCLKAYDCLGFSGNANGQVLSGTCHKIVERYGAEQEQLDNIWEYRTHAAFNYAERAALDSFHSAARPGA